MSKQLVIVESPGKIKKINEILGSNYIVKASYGHVQDLDKKTISIDVEDNFKPLYVITPDKKKVVNELKALATDCDVILAADEDREGEAIAHSISTVLKLKNPKRIVFHEITKNAITKAIQNPREINMDMVYSQQARRILDRLVGFKISPVLWKYIDFGFAKSAGRVQSVVVKIIIDKEEEIKKSISRPFLKTTLEYTHNDHKLNGVLQNVFDTEDIAKENLSKVSNKTKFKVISVENKKSIRKPSPPFITSTLLQDASTRLHFSVKRTTDASQKLYEKTLITYIRTDSPNISKDELPNIKNQIIENYGKDYYETRIYTSKNSSAQEAHECIRPTNINNIKPDKLVGDETKLYDLIWKRTIASQMANAEINVQTIQIKANDMIFTSELENVEFPGYLIVYDNSEENEIVKGKIEINVNDIVTMNKIKVTEEYTKLPLRYNEAGLVKYLEKSGIGRPSTYRSIVPKIVERNYVEIKNIDGIEKNSKQIELDSKFKIKESTKKVIFGKENQKIVPTEMGLKVNDFMITNFTPIMDVGFTANFETYLDKIAIGKANWVNVLRLYYDMFSPIVDKLLIEAKLIKREPKGFDDKMLGKNDDGMEIFVGSGVHGPYVKVSEGENKWRYASIKDIGMDEVTLEDALNLLVYPKKLGKIKNAFVILNKGQYGYYLKCSDKTISLKDVEPEDIDLDYARKLLEQEKSFKIQDKTINIKLGEYGPYLQIVGKTKQNISIPSKYNIEELTEENVLEIIAFKNNNKSYNKSYTKKYKK